MDVQEHRRARLAQPRHDAGGHGDPVADAADLDEHLAAAVRSSRVPRSEPIILGSSGGRRDPCPQGQHGEVAQRQRQGVGDVGRPRRLGQAEQGCDHALHLFLGRRALAGDGLLDLVRRVLGDLAARPAAAASARPLAWPTDMAVRALVWKKTRSTATASGFSSATSASSSS